jgi:hypothetical protein
MEQHLTANYRNAGLIPLLCKGNHPDQNTTQDYDIAKQPAYPGWNSADYIPPDNEKIESWAKAKGWIGWRLPKGIIAIDVEVPEDIACIKENCRERGIEPGIHETNNGEHFLFSADRDFSAASTVFTKSGIKVTYRVGGKNYLILAPTNNRSWERWKDFETLPLIPNDLLPYDRKNTSDVLNCFAHAVRKAYTEKHFSGYEDIDAALMAFLIDSKISPEQDHHVFQIIFDGDYDERQTSTMYERTRSLMESGSPVLGAGTFMMKVKNQGLKEIERFARELQSIQRPTENIEDTVQTDPMQYLKRGSELQLMDINVEWVIEDLIPERAIVALIGPAGYGKSTVCLNFGNAVVEGLPWLGRNTKQLLVIYDDFENPEAIIIERTRQLNIKNVYFWHTSFEVPPPRIDSPEWELYKKLTPGLLIVDGHRASQRGDENSSKDTGLVMERWKALRDLGFTIILIHHTQKANEQVFRGSQALIDQADHVLYFYPVRKPGNDEPVDSEDFEDMTYFLGTKDKTRFKHCKLYLKRAGEGRFVLAGDPADEKLTNMKDLLIQSGELSQKEFMGLIKDELAYGKTVALRLLKQGEERKFWTIRKGDKNSSLYSAFLLSPLIKGGENRKTDFGSFPGISKMINTNNSQVSDNTLFSSYPDTDETTGKQGSLSVPETSPFFTDQKTEKEAFLTNPDDGVFVPEIETDIPDAEGELCTF